MKIACTGIGRPMQETTGAFGGCGYSRIRLWTTGSSQAKLESPRHLEGLSLDLGP